MVQAKLRDIADLVKDGWANILTGLNGPGDKGKAGHFLSSRLITRPELAAMYESNGLTTRIVDIVAEDMVRAGWTIGGDEEGDLAKISKDLKLAQQLTLALKWVRLFGGALVVLDIQDGKPWDQPVDPKAKYPVRAIKVYSAARTIISSSDFSQDTASSWFEEVERFTIKRLYGPTFQVHASRCIVLKGRAIPDTNDLGGYDIDTRYWGQSVMQPLYEATRDLGQFLAGIGHLGTEMTIGKYTISNLEDLVAMNDWKSIRNRIKIIDESKSVIRAVLLGPTEKYERDSLTFTGIPDILDRLMMIVSAYSDGIPVSRLFGRSASGLNSNGEGDSQNYYDTIGAKQSAHLEGPLLSILQRINAGAGSPVKEEDLTVTFLPVWTPSQQELVTMRKTVADTDKVYVDMGILNEEQVFNTRFKGGYTLEYSIEGDWEEPEEDEGGLLEQVKALQLANGQPGQPPQLPRGAQPPKGKAGSEDDE